MLIQTESVHGVFSFLGSQLQEYGIEVLENESTELNFENAGMWIRVLATWLSKAAESCKEKEPQMAKIILSLIVVDFLLGIPGIQSIIAKSSLASLFEKPKRKCVICIPELPMLWDLV